ncbi:MULTISPECIES: hypothetical protein [Cryobacterium]|uniref:Lipoprotein n=1 Tax=Cryobacterium breve TaxID=1259258 RepID=A0ABY2J6H8_9MICO|nr:MULTISPECIES: hypothetical protein [Cryobacterium]TFC95128.1 hypothetical protein E3T20_05775 [Cryobacterium sp. TmT3-12]TFD00416.1 hypothetical protein E3O65_04890 [Cryobacterium breve]
MRTVTRDLTLSTLALLVALSLAGCTPEPEPQASESTAPTDAPVFASDEEALAAATEAYAAYLTAGDVAEGPGTPTREHFFSLSAGDAHEQDLSISSSFDEKGWTQIGSTSFDSMAVQAIKINDENMWEIRAYVCLDVSASDIVDSNGVSVSKANRPLRVPLEVAFIRGQDNGHLQVSESRVWSGSNFC